MATPTQQNLTVGFCLDESGSMSSIHQATIDGFNEYVADLAKQPGETRFFLTMFSDKGGAHPTTYRSAYTDARLSGGAVRLDGGSYRPNGNTPLFDAIGYTIKTLETAIGDSTDPVMFVIQTDGHENASREFTRQDVIDLIRRKEDEGWKFVYLGANQDEMEASRAAGAMGMSVGSSFAYDYATTGAAYGGVRAASASLRADPTLTSAQVTKTVREEHERRTKTPTASQPPIPRPKEDRGKPARSQTTASDKPNF